MPSWHQIRKYPMSAYLFFMVRETGVVPCLCAYSM